MPTKIKNTPPNNTPEIKLKDATPKTISNEPNTCKIVDMDFISTSYS